MNRKPTDIAKKVTAATLGAATVTLAFWVIPGEEPQAVQGAATVLATFGFGYFVGD